MEGGWSFDDAVPGEQRGGLGEGRDAARGFSGIGGGLQGGDGVCMQSGAQAHVEDKDNEAGDGAIAATGTSGPGTDFAADEEKEFGQEDGQQQDGENPGIEIGEPVEGEAVAAERPEEGDTFGLAGVHGDMQQACEQRREENRDAALGGAASPQNEECGGTNEQRSESRNQDGMRVIPVPVEERRGSKVVADPVEVGDNTGSNDERSCESREAREETAFQRVGSQPMSERVQRES